MLDSVLETATEKIAHTNEHGLKKICFLVMKGDCVVWLQNTFKKAYQCNGWIFLMSTRLKESITDVSLMFSKWFNGYATWLLSCRHTFVLDSKL